MKRAKATIFCLLTIIIVLWFIDYQMRDNLYFDGYKYKKYIDETEKIKKENIILREEVLKNSSYTVIEEKARTRGFQKPQFLMLHSLD